MRRVAECATSLALFVLFAVALAPSGAAAVKRPKITFRYDAATHPHVRAITSADFRERVMDPTLPALVQFYDPSSQASKDFATEVETACAALDGHVTCNAMEGTGEEGKGLLQMFTGSTSPSLPTTLLFNPEMLPVAGGQEGQYMKYPAQFGGKRTAKALVEWALEFSAGHEIDRLDDMVDWKDFVTKNSAVIAEFPKFVLLTSSNVTSPLFKSLSHEFRYGAAFAVVHNANLTEAEAAFRGDDVTTLKGELLALFGVGSGNGRDALPTIVVATGAQSNDFELIRDAGNPDMGIAKLRDALAKHAFPAERRREVMPHFLEEAQRRRKKEAAEAKMNQALPPITAYDAQTFEEHCVKRKKGICAAVFVENPEDEEKLAWLQGASRKMAQRVNTPSRLVVVNAPQQYELAQFFGAADMGYPTVVFINPARKQYFNLIGSFSERGVVNFFADRVAKGKGKAFDPKKVPKFAEPSTEDDDAAGDSGAGGAGGDGDNEEIMGDL
eukprot:CAMPEP_0174832034 /NCGR_PEP_ID=MMETSP1114-20130205/3449_1 /TAXON_ID=312471 /ORGANISM="Neobodo designis, Strain CCAP 1951/1" /LENGTH=498 /DNA_ID=CAMNT_0016065885 /DNA_START=63 /DNA_END=1559 /DNA_ORIENTATION=+